MEDFLEYSLFFHSWQRVTNPHILWWSPRLLASFPLAYNLHPPLPFFALFLSLNGWLHNIWCVALLNDIMDRHMSSFGTIVPEGPSCVFHATRYQVYWHIMWFFASTLIWHLTDTQRHTADSGANRLIYKLIPPVMCWQQLCVLHWIYNLLMSIFIYFPRCLCFLKITHL